MANTIGTLVAFDAKNQTWEEYFGPSTYNLMRSLLSPEKPKDKTYQQLVELLKNHFHPKPSEIAQSSRTRKPEESVLGNVAELRTDWYVGLMTSIFREVSSEMELTFDKALFIAVAVETANKNAQNLNIPSASVKFMKAKKGFECPLEFM
uniref:Uncharacterized protein n=1 Tax=Paramormyrops kingsleyae TaxID=1676925 RepID=A0A3B3S818_9TELE